VHCTGVGVRRVENLERASGLRGHEHAESLVMKKSPRDAWCAFPSALRCEKEKPATRDTSPEYIFPLYLSNYSSDKM
jgi:hypothetical protein